MTRSLLDSIVAAVIAGGDVTFIVLDDTCPTPSRSRYTTGVCRCTGCTDAHSAYTVRQKRRRRRQLGGGGG